MTNTELYIQLESPVKVRAYNGSFVTVVLFSERGKVAVHLTADQELMRLLPAAINMALDQAAELPSTRYHQDVLMVEKPRTQKSYEIIAA